MTVRYFDKEGRPHCYREHGLHFFHQETGIEIVDHLVTTFGYTAFLMDGDRIVYEVRPKDKSPDRAMPWESEDWEGRRALLSEGRKSLLKTWGRLLATLRWVQGEKFNPQYPNSTWPSDLICDLFVYLQDCGLCSQRSEGCSPGSYPCAEEFHEAIQGALSTTDLELALTFLYRSLNTPDDEQAKRELSYAVHFAADAFRAREDDPDEQAEMLNALPEPLRALFTEPGRAFTPAQAPASWAEELSGTGQQAAPVAVRAAEPASLPALDLDPSSLTTAPEATDRNRRAQP
jgi:hypothetical protein